jgi:hypothetical protein
MRLWSLHPKYLDSKGLVAVWREGLLALSVLKGIIKGYRNHPQLDRFREQKNPVESIKCYLRYIYKESRNRGYQFNVAKIGAVRNCPKMKVTCAQVSYEMDHLKSKLKVRSPKKYQEIRRTKIVEPHPLFVIIDGSIEEWERVGK